MIRFVAANPYPSAKLPAENGALSVTDTDALATSEQPAKTRLLDKQAYRSTFSIRMHPIEPEEPLSSALQLYIAFIPKTDYKGFDCSERRIHSVWLSDTTPFLHILLSAKDKPHVFMVIIIDRIRQSIFGHHLVDLQLD